MTRATALDPHPTAVRDWRPRLVHLWYVLAGTVALAAALLLAPLLRMPAHVGALTFDNPTGYDITIESSQGGDDGWTPVGTVRAGSSATFDRVVDQGGRWAFRFSSQGQQGGHLDRTRAELDAADWKVDIPAEVGDTLAANGAPEPR